MPCLLSLRWLEKEGSNIIVLKLHFLIPLIRIKSFCSDKNKKVCWKIYLTFQLSFVNKKRLCSNWFSRSKSFLTPPLIHCTNLDDVQNGCLDKKGVKNGGMIGERYKKGLAWRGPCKFKNFNSHFNIRAIISSVWWKGLCSLYNIHAIIILLGYTNF